MFAHQVQSGESADFNVEAPFYYAQSTAFFFPAILFALLSLIAIAVNYYIQQYPGNNYLQVNFVLLGSDLLLIYVGAVFLQGRDGVLARIIKEVTYFLMVLALGCLATTAVQFTPFPTIDQHILAVESFFYVDTHALMIWASTKPLLKTVLEIAYVSLTYQMICIPLVIILAGRIDLIREHYFLILISALIGFVFYYFFPTTAPASVINSIFFNESQRATYLKFFQIHHYIQPTTMDGGMIALPSFHVIWAWLCLRLVREWKVAFGLLLLINVTMVASCVLLGWHYCLDVLGSVVVIALSHALYRTCIKFKSRSTHA